MAFTQLYDQYAPILGGSESEEERRRRMEEEAAAATPVTQTIKTNPVTGEQEMTIKGSPQDLSAANPLTPTVSGINMLEQQPAPAPMPAAPMPAAPAVAPVEPAPAPVAAPEVKPPTIEELAQQYQLNQMPQAGEGVQVAGPVVPGAMKIPQAQQAQRDQQGRLPILQNELANASARLNASSDPAEQQRLQGDIAALQREIASTSGGAQRVAAPVAPGQAPAAAPAPAAPAMAPEQVQRETQMRDFQAASKNPDAMIQYMARKDVPEDLKTAMKLNHYETLLAEDRKTKAEQRVINTITNNPQSLPKIINDKSEEGSIAKAFLYSLIGFKSGADAEVAKMNLPGEWKPAMNAEGDSGTVLYSTNGKPLQGVKADGTKMSAQELAAFASAGTAKFTKPDVSMQDVEKGGVKGRVVTTYDRQNRPTTRVESGGKMYDYDASWKPVSISTAAEKAETAANVKLRYAGPTAYTAAGAKFAGEFNAANGTNIGYQTQTPGAPLVDLNTGKPVSIGSGGVISVTQSSAPSAAPAAPAATRPAPAAGAVAPVTKDTGLPPQPRFKEPGYENESPVAFADRTKAWSTTYGKQYENQVKNTKEAKQLLPFISEMKSLVDQSTGSGIGAIVDRAGNFVGYSTSGAEAIAAIGPLASKVLMGVQRFEGPQSDKDVASYKEAAGRLSDPTVSPKQKQAAFNTIIEIMKRNAPELDWSSVDAAQASETRKKADDIINRKKKP